MIGVAGPPEGEVKVMKEGGKEGENEKEEEQQRDVR